MTQECCYVREHICYQEIVESGIHVTLNLMELFPLDKEGIQFAIASGVELEFKTICTGAIPEGLQVLAPQLYFMYTLWTKITL